VRWDGNWIHYLDAMLQLPTVYHTEKRGELVVPVTIHELCIDPAATGPADSPASSLSSSKGTSTQPDLAPGRVVLFSTHSVFPLQVWRSRGTTCSPTR